MATPEKCVYVFASKLGCKKEISDPFTDRSETSSMLPCFLENDASRCTIPSLYLGKCSRFKPSEAEAIKELKSSLEARKSTISLAPTAVLQNVSRSFGTMIDNRIKQVHLMMLASADENSKEHQMNLQLSSLLCSDKNCPTSFTSAESSFRPLPVNKGFVKQHGRIRAVILPLVFKATININILGVKELAVTITAPGTIVGTFVGSCTRLRTADITLDTSAIYLSMRRRCDQVVTATFEAASQLLNLSSSKEQAEAQVTTSEKTMGPPKCAPSRINSPTHRTGARISHPVSP